MSNCCALNLASFRKTRPCRRHLGSFRKTAHSLIKLGSFRKTHNQRAPAAELFLITPRHFAPQKTPFLRPRRRNLIFQLRELATITPNTLKRLTDCDTIATGQGVLF
jgi:hypothetical protein